MRMVLEVFKMFWAAATKKNIGISTKWLGSLGLLAVCACSSGGAAQGDADPLGVVAKAPEATRAYLSDVGSAGVVPVYDAFLAASLALQGSADAWLQETRLLRQAGDATALANISQRPGLSEARADWQNAMQAWQVAELLQWGPAGPSWRSTLGEDRRDPIYSWPTTSACRVAQVLVDQSYATEDFAATALVNVRGLDALETLLFADVNESTCPPQVAVVRDGTWDALLQNENGLEAAERRAAYGHVLALDLAAQAQALVDRWALQKGNFLQEWSDAGSAESRYKDLSEALDEMLAAAFYFETQVKDQKLKPWVEALDEGGCAAACVAQNEGPFAALGAQHVMANVRGFGTLFLGSLPLATPAADEAAEIAALKLQGQAHTGLDDLLQAVGQSDIAEDLFTSLAKVRLAAQQWVDAGGVAGLDPAHPQFAASGTALRALQDASSDLATRLKVDLSVALRLNVPLEGGGDND